MKTYFLLVLFTMTIVVFPTIAQTETYDPKLAMKLKSDDIGMKKYVMVFLYFGDRVAE